MSEKIAAGFRRGRMARQPTVYVAPAAPMLDSVRWYLRDFAVVADPARADVVVLANSSRTPRISSQLLWAGEISNG